MKTYNLTFFLPAVFALTFLALATLLSTIEYLQNRSEIFNQASQNLHDSGLQLAHTIEYARANNAREQIRSAMRQFVLRDSAEFSALVDEHYQVIYSSQEHWHNLSALDALPDTASLFLTEKTDDFRARDHRQDSAILVSIPVITYGIDTLDSGHGRWQLILQDDISGRLQTARHQTMMRTLPMLAVALLLLLMTYSVMRKLVIDPLRVLESMAHQLKQGQLKLSNPLTGDTAQQQLAETLVETGAQLEQQILQIREKEQRLSITLDSIGDAVIVTDKEGKVIQ
ncbi:diguanylate cyclase/phosphodiesterase (GGDEF & EAL domains) with PAS/PAC sensor(s) [Methylophaga lonarensis MPL]|uniref:Diguanylate cyclase/phosphodiesterase (GGDEF & EAL domains) with PAS/PAC sensor(S) n=1 Tax=Methylophaga lonarensis MPL TaxID=1286106 RepID=M7NXM3_9GAMM|nr:hypothetical protein [Methylophaga lonarensis]EMR11936.1 diguanylate cyclase/phosphodiesterase (GGDEF & EAL domains) with PAS/PAC sensor(s) [Methylophaga lonarensis MPL]